jgi:hypothetical protein
MLPVGSRGQADLRRLWLLDHGLTEGKLHGNSIRFPHKRLAKLSAARHPQTEQLLDLPLRTRLILGRVHDEYQ